MKPFRWQERRHVPIDRSLIRKHVNQRKYRRDSLGRFLPDVEKFQTARNVRNDVNSFLTYRKRTHRRNEDESNRPCLSHGLEKERVESRRKGGSFTEHKIHAFHVSSRGSFRASFSCRVWTGEEFRSVSSDSFLSFPTLLPP